MSIDTKCAHITPADGNIFADLGFGPEEALRLKAEANRRIAERLMMKEQLIAELASWIAVRRLQHAEAAEILGVSCECILNLVNRKSDEFTVKNLVDMLTRAGKHL